MADGVNVAYDVFGIEMKITRDGACLVREPGVFVPHRGRRTKGRKYKELDGDLTYTPNQLDRDVVAENQIRLVGRTFRERLPEIFPGRTEVPKTLVFAKTDLHAEDVVRIIREEFGRGNDFCQKITSKTTGQFWVNNHAHVVQLFAGMPFGYLEHFLNATRLDFSITGTAQPKLTQAAMNRIPVPIPPLEEQVQIIAEVEERLSVIVASEKEIEQSLQRASRLHQGILKQAFEGMLVPQDPRDEPASVLYAQGVKANVLFFDARPGREAPWTTKAQARDHSTCSASAGLAPRDIA